MAHAWKFADGWELIRPDFSFNIMAFFPFQFETISTARKNRILYLFWKDFLHSFLIYNLILCVSFDSTNFVMFSNEMYRIYAITSDSL